MKINIAKHLTNVKQCITFDTYKNTKILTTMTTTIAPHLKVEVQNIVNILSEERYNKRFASGVKKAQESEDWDALRRKTNEKINNLHAELSKATINKDEEMISVYTMQLADYKAMQLGIEREIQSNL